MPDVWQSAYCQLLNCSRVQKHKKLLWGESSLIEKGFRASCKGLILSITSILSILSILSEGTLRILISWDWHREALRALWEQIESIKNYFYVHKKRMRPKKIYSYSTLPLLPPQRRLLLLCAIDCQLIKLWFRYNHPNHSSVDKLEIQNNS